MKLTNYILLTAILFVAMIDVFSQTKQISREEYYQPFQSAIKRTSEISHRRTYQEKYYKNGKQSGMTTIIDEFLNPDRKHLLRIENSAGRESKSEIIQIGETYYCRENNGKWTQSGSWCLGNNLSGRIRADESKYTVQETKLNGQNVKLFQNYSIYKNTDPANKDKKEISYVQDNYWLNDNGLLLRYEIKSGLSETKSISNLEITIYEYIPKNLKIEAPIK